MGRKNNRKGNRHESHREWEYEDLPLHKTGLESLRIKHPKYLNDSQKEAHEVVKENSLSFLCGPAGTSKSFWAVYEMCCALKAGRVKRALITRPTVLAGKDLGAMPGPKLEKMMNYMRPIIDHMNFFLGEEMTKKLIEEEIVEVEAIQFARGRNLNDCFVIVDEGQNCEKLELKLMLTRIGFNAQCVVTIDPDQVDLKYPERSCAYDMWRFEDKDDIGIFSFNDGDIVRSELCSTIINAYKETRHAPRIQSDSDLV